MDTVKMKQLLEKFYDGQTTDQEEQLLKEFFQGADIPDSLLPEKELFLQFTAHEVAVPTDLEERLSQKIDEWSRPRTIRFRWIGSIAASIIVLLTIGALITPWGEPTRKDTYTNVEDAYVEAQKALVMFSSSVNKGIGQVEEVKGKTTKTIKKVDKQLRLFDTKLKKEKE